MRRLSRKLLLCSSEADQIGCVGPLLMRSWKLGPATPYSLSIFARLAYLALIFFMPESLTPEKRKLSAVNTDADDLASTKPAAPLIARLLAAPKELVEPFRILLPEKVNGRRDYRLLVASSYFFLMVIPVRTARKCLTCSADIPCIEQGLVSLDVASDFARRV